MRFNFCLYQIFDFICISSKYKTQSCNQYLVISTIGANNCLQPASHAAYQFFNNFLIKISPFLFQNAPIPFCRPGFVLLDGNVAKSPGILDGVEIGGVSRPQIAVVWDACIRHDPFSQTPGTMDSSLSCFSLELQPSFMTLQIIFLGGSACKSCSQIRICMC